MSGTVHLLFGAALAALIPHAPTMFIVAFFSHYLLDFIPHIDPDTLAEKTKPYTTRQRLALGLDIVLVAGLLLGLFLLPREPFPFIVGAVAAQLPDLLVPLESYQSFSPLKKMHEMFHWNDRRAGKWSWYLAGIIMPLVLTSFSLYILFTA